MPIHGVFVRAGLAVKPWFIPLGIAVVALLLATRRIRPALRAMGWWVGGGLGLLLASALVGVVAAASGRMVALRHGGGVLLVALVVAVIAAAPRIPHLGVMLRIGAIAMAGAALVQAIALYAGWVSVASLMWDSRFAEQAAEVTAAGVLVVNGTHVDSNFAALYATTWLFLIAAYPADRWFGRVGDGVVAGLLLVQLVLTASKGGWIALIVGSLFVVGGRLASRRRRSSEVWTTVGVAIGTVAVALALVALADANDDRSELANNVSTRIDQFGVEVGRFTDLVAVVLPDVSGADLGSRDPEAPENDDRSEIWLVYARAFEAHPLAGVGYGVSAEGYSYAHNAPLESAAGGGVAGLAGWVMLAAGMVMATVANIRRSPQAWPLAAALVAVGVGSMVLTTNYEPLLGLVIGLTVAPHFGEADTEDQVSATAG